MQCVLLLLLLFEVFSSFFRWLAEMWPFMCSFYCAVRDFLLFAGGARRWANKRAVHFVLFSEPKDSCLKFHHGVLRFETIPLTVATQSFSFLLFFWFLLFGQFFYTQCFGWVAFYIFTNSCPISHYRTLFLSHYLALSLYFFSCLLFSFIPFHSSSFHSFIGFQKMKSSKSNTLNTIWFRVAFIQNVLSIRSITSILWPKKKTSMEFQSFLMTKTW